MQVEKFSDENFWSEISNVEQLISDNISVRETKELRKTFDIIFNLLESAKYAMIIGRSKRAWSFYFIAKKIIIEFHREINVNYPR